MHEVQACRDRSRSRNHPPAFKTTFIKPNTNEAPDSGLPLLPRLPLTPCSFFPSGKSYGEVFAALTVLEAKGRSSCCLELIRLQITFCIRGSSLREGGLA